MLAAPAGAVACRAGRRDRPRGIQITPAEDGGLVLATDLAFDFSPRLEEAVGKGLTLHFVAEFN